jgi:hypothetical protein
MIRTFTTFKALLRIPSLLRALALGAAALAALGAPPAWCVDNNGPWTPEQSKTANHVPGTPSDPRGWYPPEPTPPTPQTANSTPSVTPPAPTSRPSDNNGAWTPEQSKTADHVPGTPSDPRGFYPPATPPGKPTDLGEDLSNLGSAVATSDLANPLIQGGKAIGKTIERSAAGDKMGTYIEAADGAGHLSAIGLGATEGAAYGTAVAGPLGGLVGGIIGGFLGHKAWDYTGGALSDSSRAANDQMHEQAIRNATLRTPTRPVCSPPRGGCPGNCP